MGAGKFCRKCGAASGLEALSVQEATPYPPPDYEKGFKKLFMGLAFLIIAVFPIFTSGKFWWWMLFPAVPLLAAGIGEFMRARHVHTLPPSRVASLSAEPGQVMPAAQQTASPRVRNTAELMPPAASVTEGTTQHLNKEKARRD
jgi:hypothetical protein